MNSVDAYFDDLLRRKLVMITGKGGVGKSFLSLMLALRAARQGKRVLLVELTANSQHQEALSLPEKEHTIQGYDQNLHHINIQYESNFRDYVVKYLGMERVFNQVFNRQVVKSFLRMVPGLNEITFLGRLYFECMVNRDKPFDLVIFDGFSSGHFYKLLTTPEGMMRSGLVGPVLEESGNIKNFLADRQKVAVVYTCLFEKLVVAEVNEFIQKINDRTVCHVDAVFLNKCFRSQSSQWQGDDPVPAYLRHVTRLQEEAVTSLQSGSLGGAKLFEVHHIGPVLPRTIPTKFVSYWDDMQWSMTC